jgi:subtilisin family serine protease
MRTSRVSVVSVALAAGIAMVAVAHANQPSKVTPRLSEAVRAAAPNETVRAWVYFTDKAGAAPVELTERALARRARNRVAVRHHDRPVAAAYLREVARSGARVRHASRWLNAVSVEADAGDIEAIASLPFVRRIDRVRAYREPLPRDGDGPQAAAPPRARATFALDYGPSLTQNAQINVPAVHDQGYTGSGVLIAMLDSGFNNLSHEALVDIDVLATWDFVNGDSVVSDQVGQAGSGNHGTYTLSALAGFEPGDLIGPAYGATFLLAKTENTDWERHVEEDDWIAGAEWADALGADIISSSLGYATGFTNGEPDYAWGDMDGNTTIVAVGADIAASVGILVVNSAGNGGFVSLPANTLGSPADGDSVLAIGAVDAAGVRAGFSSVGPSADGQIKPDVMAMGSSVIAASPFSPNGYSLVGGTSLACPLVAGVAALLLQARPTATHMEIVAALHQTASQSATPDREYGYGIVDAAAAIDHVLSGVATPTRANLVLFPAHPNPFNPTTTIRYEIATRARVNLSVFDVRGAWVATLVDEEQPAGSKSVVWNANGLASGVYLCRLVAGGEQQTNKLVLLK